MSVTHTIFSNEVRCEQREKIGKVFNPLIKKVWLELVKASLVYEVATYFGQEGLQQQNPYTTRHLLYNQLYFWIAIRTYSILLALFYSQNNFGFRIGCYCLDYLFLMVLVLARLALVSYFFFMVGTDGLRFFVMTNNLNKDNWWKDPEEPFLTNCSMINAYITWILWILFMPIFFIIRYILPIYLVIFVLVQKKDYGLSWGDIYKKACCFYCCIIQKFVFRSYLFNIIKGTYFDSLNNDEIRRIAQD